MWTGVGGGPEKVSAGWHGMSNVICVFSTDTGFQHKVPI